MEELPPNLKELIKLFQSVEELIKFIGDGKIFWSLYNPEFLLSKQYSIILHISTKEPRNISLEQIQNAWNTRLKLKLLFYKNHNINHTNTLQKAL